MTDRTAAVYTETGKRRVFACAVDWPGWCRAGKTEELALASLAEVAQRYQTVVAEAGLDLPGSEFKVVERLAGTGTTDFGAPDAKASSDWRPMKAAEGSRLAKLVRASWAVLHRAAARAPAKLPKGPRGGGRDRDPLLEHVLAAEAAYARQVGIRLKAPALDDRLAIEALRDAISEFLSQPWRRPRGNDRSWPPRYAARRIAWHVLDHAWELEDKSK
ncbi:MAG TPA: hypothetical protein VFO84_06430 [Dehalococcoidia bacterium]|nr:hypothetical protein [Dehalococcoidia bacterium]